MKAFILKIIGLPAIFGEHLEYVSPLLSLSAFMIVTGFVMMGANPWWYLVAAGIVNVVVRLLLDIKSWVELLSDSTAFVGRCIRDKQIEYE